MEKVVILKENEYEDLLAESDSYKRFYENGFIKVSFFDEDLSCHEYISKEQSSELRKLFERKRFEVKGTETNILPIKLIIDFYKRKILEVSQTERIESLYKESISNLERDNLELEKERNILKEELDTLKNRTLIERILNK